jgi:flagellar biosynthesis protein FlhF
MHLKRYRAVTVREALSQARQELGRDALVLSTRLVPVRGMRGWLGAREVELTAALDGDVSGSRPATRTADTEPLAAVSATASQLAEPAWATAEPEPVAARGPQDPLVAMLCATGLNKTLAERIARELPKAQRRSASPAMLTTILAQHLGAVSSGDEPYAPVELFVGPPGAGKTTTIAKIAAQERARRGARLSLLAADGFRVGAVEQLRLYADIIGSPFAVARTPREIEQSLSKSRGPVLVDTAGRSSRDDRALEVVSMLADVPGVRTHLVMPAAASLREATRLLETYGDRARRVVLTRLDEADSISPLMHLFAERDLAVSYLGVGQRVPEDLERGTPHNLARHIVGHDASEEVRA